MHFIGSRDDGATHERSVSASAAAASPSAAAPAEPAELSDEDIPF